MSHPHAHPVIHLELQTDDAAGACAFYASLFGWRAERIVLGAGAYLTLALGDVLGGGVIERKAGRTSWRPYVGVVDVGETTERARLLGAAILLEPREGPAGWRSVLASDSGGEVALWQPKLERVT
jgi:predicted enzyme related to lactoylglutathione lyase